jgi:hypothetical protein
MIGTGCHALGDALGKLEAWRDDYNGERPHGALRNMTPEEFAQRGGILPSTRSDERHNDTANDAPDEGPELHLTVAQLLGGLRPPVAV